MTRERDPRYDELESYEVNANIPWEKHGEAFHNIPGSFHVCVTIDVEWPNNDGQHNAMRGGVPLGLWLSS